MILIVYIAVTIALGVIVMMRNEIMNGFFRLRDYLLTTPLLFTAALIMLWFDSVLAALGPSLWATIVPLRVLIAFGIFVMVWGGTLTIGALILRLLVKPFQRT